MFLINYGTPRGNDSMDSLKYNKINRYKFLIKRIRGNIYYINRKKDKFLHLFKMNAKKFWR